MIEKQSVNCQQVIEQVVTNGLGFKAGIGGEIFPNHLCPENTISILEHLAEMDHESKLLPAIYWARNRFGLGFDKKLSPRSFDTARSLISIYGAFKDLHDKEVEQVHELGYRQGLAAGHRKGIDYGMALQRLSQQTGLDIANLDLVDGKKILDYPFDKLPILMIREEGKVKMEKLGFFTNIFNKGR